MQLNKAFFKAFFVLCINNDTDEWGQDYDFLNETDIMFRGMAQACDLFPC